MALITQEQLQQNKIVFVSIDKDNGGFIVEDKTYPGIEGTLLGFNVHTYEYKGRTQTKFDVYIKDDALYEVEFGKYSWLAFKLLNQLISIPEKEFTQPNGKIKLLLTKRDDNLNIFVQWNGKYLTWKYRFNVLKFAGKQGLEREVHRNNIIDRWCNILLEICLYDPTKIVSIDNEEEISIEYEEDLPF